MTTPPANDVKTLVANSLQAIANAEKHRQAMAAVAAELAATPKPVTPPAEVK